jgi:hypothetical protein
MTDEWTTEHAWRGRIQTRAKAMLDTDGQQTGTLREFTGLVHVICNCGFSSGWVQAPPAEPGYSDMKALLPEECRAAADRQEREILDAWAQEREPHC